MDDMTLRPAHWYRPGHLERREGAAGTYQVRPDGAVDVWMHGSWYDVPSMALGGIKELIEDFPSIMYGDAFGRKVTLVGTRQGNSRTNMSRLQVTEILGRYSLEGMWLDEPELSVTKAHVQFIDQDLWAEWSAFPAKIEFDDNHLTGITARYEQPDEHECGVAGGTLTLADASSHQQHLDPNGWDFRSRSVFKFAFEKPVSLDALFRDYLAPLEFMMTSTTGRRSGILSLTVTNSEWIIPDERHSSQRWATIRLRHPDEHSDKITGTVLLHRLSDLDFASQVPRVFDVATSLRYPLEHYSTLRSGVSAGPLAEFIAAAQLAESTQRALDASMDRKSLATRLRELDSDSGGLISSMIEDEEWSKHVGELRNVVAHGYGGSRVLTEDQRSVQAGTAILELLFEVRLLVELGFTPKRARELAVQRGYHGFTVRTIKEGYPHIKAVSEWTAGGGNMSTR